MKTTSTLTLAAAMFVATTCGINSAEARRPSDALSRVLHHRTIVADHHAPASSHGANHQRMATIGISTANSSEADRPSSRFYSGGRMNHRLAFHR